ncbi:MAG: stage V sporulation protein AC [Oscillospiraceae bacterium]|nr:stage V sporulation protein AC [Oscillospiraceae bacterium]
MVKKASPNTKYYKTLPLAFIAGGSICALGQGITKIFEYYGFTKLQSSAWTTVSLIILSALLTGLGVYQRIAKHAGAGTLVPITGFANAVVSPAIESKTEGFVLGVGAKIFTIAGPVILYGVAASVLYGLIYYFISR